MRERFETEAGHGGVDRADVVERVLAGEHDAADAEFLQDGGAARVVHGHLRRAVDLEAGIHALDEPDEADVLHDGGVDAAVDAFAEMGERTFHLVRLHQDVERQVDARAAVVGDRAGLFELGKGELGAIVARIELLDAKVDGVGAVRDGCADGIKEAAWLEKSGGGSSSGKKKIPSSVAPSVVRLTRAAVEFLTFRGWAGDPLWQ